MEIKKVMYIVPSAKREYKKTMKGKIGAAPIGIGLLASVLKLHGYEVTIVDMFAEDYSAKDLKQRIEMVVPDVIGISASFTESAEVAYNIAKMIKKNFQCVVMAGGVHTTFLPEEVLAHDVDYVILNEGEATTVKLLEYLKADATEEQLKSLESLGFKDSFGDVWINKQKNPIEDLDSLPIYDFYDLQLQEYATPLASITSRGCPGDCVYCASRAMFGKKYRQRSAEAVISEVYLLYKYIEKSESVLKNYLSIFDDTFTANRKRLNKFCDYMIESGLSKRIAWKCESRIDILTEEMLIKMKNSGCIAVHVGLESTNQGIIDSLNKHIKVEKMEEVIQLMAKYKIEPLCSFIIGNHEDTHETLTESIKFMDKIQRQYGAYVAISPNTPLPGTALYLYPDKFGITIKSDKWADYSLMKVIIDTKNFTQDEIRNYYSWASELLANREDEHDT